MWHHPVFTMVPEPPSDWGAAEVDGGRGGAEWAHLLWVCWAAFGAWAPGADLEPADTRHATWLNGSWLCVTVFTKDMNCPPKREEPIKGIAGARTKGLCSPISQCITHQVALRCNGNWSTTSRGWTGFQDGTLKLKQKRLRLPGQGPDYICCKDIGQEGGLQSKTPSCHQRLVIG